MQGGAEEKKKKKDDEDDDEDKDVDDEDELRRQREWDDWKDGNDIFIVNVSFVSSFQSLFH